MSWEYKDYYKENRERLLERRRRRYRTDPDYRKKRKADALRYYNTNVKKEVPVARQVIRRAGKTYITVGKLAQAIRRSEDTIRRYHRSGILPPTTVPHLRGWRLYTVGQAQLLQRVFRLLDERKINLELLRATVKKNWRKYEATAAEGKGTERHQDRGDHNRVPHRVGART